MTRQKLRYLDMDTMERLYYERQDTQKKAYKARQRKSTHKSRASVIRNRVETDSSAFERMIRENLYDEIEKVC